MNRRSFTKFIGAAFASASLASILGTKEIKNSAFSTETLQTPATSGLDVTISNGTITAVTVTRAGAGYKKDETTKISFPQRSCHE